jgi:hypothetical protein
MTGPIKVIDGMKVEVQLKELEAMHPHLLWGDFIGAAVIMLRRQSKSPFQFDVAVADVPRFNDDLLQLFIRPPRLSTRLLKRLERTHEPTRLVEYAAIALAGLALYHAGRHIIHKVAVRGSGGDYVVDEILLMEVAGRSRRADFQGAWDHRWQRLLSRGEVGFFVFIAEFETPAGRLAFHSRGEY